MPYIKYKDRDRIEEEVFKDNIGLKDLGVECKTSGELNYVLTDIIIGYMKGSGKSYSTMNDIVGALECCKQEFIRRVVNPYEDEKIKINGDVYP